VYSLTGVGGEPIALLCRRNNHRLKPAVVAPQKSSIGSLTAPRTLRFTVRTGNSFLFGGIHFRLYDRIYRVRLVSYWTPKEKRKNFTLNSPIPLEYNSALVFSEYANTGCSLGRSRYEDHGSLREPCLGGKGRTKFVFMLCLSGTRVVASDGAIEGS
jgi:hypothetical protein